MNDKLTPFGKIVRKHRIDRGLLLKDMAEAIGLSSAGLSGIETGHKPIPADLPEKIANMLDLSDSDRNELKNATQLSRSDFRIQKVEPDRRDVAAALARRFNDYSKDDIEAIRRVILKNGVRK